MEFCIELGHWRLRDHPPDRLVASVRTAESAGVHSVWVPEDPFHWDAFALLGSLATATDRVRLGPGVTSPYLRPPHLQAMAISTLDRLSQGRAFLGLGRSLPRWYQRLLSMDVGDPVRVMEETISLLRQWWSPPYQASAAGHFNVNRLTREFHGVQPHLPIYLAAVGPRMVRLAARLADGILLAWPSRHFLEITVKQFRQHAANAGRDPDNMAVIVQTGIRVTEAREEALDQLKEQMAVIHSVPGLGRALASPGHNVAEVLARVRSALRSEQVLAAGGWMREFRQVADWSAVRAAIPSDLIDQVALVGPPSALRRRLADYQALGVTHIFVPGPDTQASDEYRALLASIKPSAGNF